MTIGQLTADVRSNEQAELQRLEGAVTDCAGACGRSACVAAAGQFVEQHEPRPRATSEEQMQINADVTQARETHVTGYAEHRGSLNDKKYLCSCVFSTTLAFEHTARPKPHIERYQYTL